MLSAMLVLGACSSDATPNASGQESSSSTGSAPPPTDVTSDRTADPCSLLTADEAAGLVGGAVTVGSVASSAGGQNCEYTLTGGSAYVLVSVFKGAQYYDPSVGITDPLVLSGIGDRAFIEGDPSAAPIAGFIKDDTVVSIHVAFADPPKRATFVEVLTAAASRL